MSVIPRIADQGPDYIDTRPGAHSEFRYVLTPEQIDQGLARTQWGAQPGISSTYRMQYNAFRNRLNEYDGAFFQYRTGQMSAADFDQHAGRANHARNQLIQAVGLGLNSMNVPENQMNRDEARLYDELDRIRTVLGNVQHRTAPQLYQEYQNYLNSQAGSRSQSSSGSDSDRYGQGHARGRGGMGRR